MIKYYGVKLSVFIMVQNHEFRQTQISIFAYILIPLNHWTGYIYLLSDACLRD